MATAFFLSQGNIKHLFNFIFYFNSLKMNTMLFPKISLVLNILVFIPVYSGILLQANWAVDSYGIETPARGILLSL